MGMKIKIEVLEREGAPAYVATADGKHEIWSFCSHFVDNPRPLNILQSWADHFECATGTECMADVLAAMDKVKDHEHVDDETRQQLADLKQDHTEELARRHGGLES